MANPTSRVFGDYAAVAAEVPEVPTDSEAGNGAARLTDSVARSSLP